jgi:two-component system response regulator HydG
MNVIERCVALGEGPHLRAADLPGQVREPKPVDFLAGAISRRLTLEQLEREYIERVLADEGGNNTRAAQRLGLDRKTLYRKLEEWGKGRRATSDGGESVDR